jgi:hypothetical protein
MGKKSGRNGGDKKSSWHEQKENLVSERKQTHPMGALSRNGKSMEH